MDVNEKQTHKKHLNIIVIVSFKIQCVPVQHQNNNNNNNKW